MPSLLDLPLELLSQVVRETIPTDFEAAALSCQTLFAASNPFRTQYNTRKQRFRKFTLSRRLDERPDGAEESPSGEYWDELTNKTGIQISNTRQLLEQIALDPSIANYIQSLDLNGPGNDEEDEEMFELGETPLPENVVHLVHTSPFIEAVDGDKEHWVGGIKLVDIEADVFLLTLLPNVRELRLHTRWGNLDPFNRRQKPQTERLWPVLKLITHRANHPTEFPDAPLSKLRTIRPCGNHDYEDRIPLTPFVPFMAMNSVTEVLLSDCIFNDDGYTGIEFDPVMERYSTNLRKLSLESSIAGAEELSQLLSRIPNLEIFEFSHAIKWHGCGYSWNWGAFLDVVQETCAKTLKELAVTMDVHYGNPGATLMDMTRFERLTVLDLDVKMLCGRPYDPSMRDLEYEQFEGPDHAASPRLADLLPASLEQLNLYLMTFDAAEVLCVGKMLGGLAEARDTRLKKLDQLKIFVPNVPDNAVHALQAAKDSGFSILYIGTTNTAL